MARPLMQITSAYVAYDVVADFSTKQTVSVAADTTVTITGLTPASTYYFRVKGVCGDTAVSDYSTVVKAVTAYVLPFTESYSSTSLPDNWNRLQGDITAILDGIFVDLHRYPLHAGYTRNHAEYHRTWRTSVVRHVAGKLLLGQHRSDGICLRRT